MSTSERIAVVFVHGQGEQRPMDDVRELARTMWDADPRLQRADGEHPRSFTIPDPQLDGADFQRVTTEDGPYTKRIDFFEFYWADLMRGNRLDHLTRWFMALQRRPRRQVPKSILPVRQFAVRGCEAILLLAMLFAFTAALLLPPTPTVWSQADVLQLTLLPLPSPADHPWMMGLLAFAFLLTTWLTISINEAAGDGVRGARDALMHWMRNKPRKDQVEADPVEQLRKKSRRGNGLARAGVFGGIIMFILLVMLGVWLGPTAEWGDLRLPIFLLVFMAGFIATFWRTRLATATWLALVAAALALVCAFAGVLDGHNLLAFEHAESSGQDGSASTFDKLFSGLGLVPNEGRFNFDPAEVDCFKENPNCPPRKDLYYLSSVALQSFAWLLMSLQVFAAFWFLGALSRTTGAQPRAGIRGALVGVTVLISGVLAWLLLTNGWANPPFPWMVFSTGMILLAVVVALALVVLVAGRSFLIPVMADSARYLSREPENVGARHKIRERGIQLLTRLHAPQAGGRDYTRVIVVAHSLGSVIAYELLADFWARRCHNVVLSQPDQGLESTPAGQLLHEIVRSSDTLRRLGRSIRREGDSRERQRLIGESRVVQRSHAALQEKFATLLKRSSIDGTNDAECAAADRSWLVTDLITLGSPLAHAEFLLANGPEDLKARQRAREMPTCPASPMKEGDNGYTFRDSDRTLHLSHSAMFSAVRWTNLYFRTESFILVGDAISGEIAPQFGFGVRDVSLDHADTGAVFAHNEYWRSRLDIQPLRDSFRSNGGPCHLVALKEALDLGDLSKAINTAYRGAAWP